MSTDTADKDHKLGFGVDEKGLDLAPLWRGHNQRSFGLSAAIEVQYNEERGRHIIAKEYIPVGAVIIRERPFVYSVFDSCSTYFCQCCLLYVPHDQQRYLCETCKSDQLIYCSEVCRQQDHSRFHQFECGLLRERLSKMGLSVDCLLLAIRMISQTPIEDILLNAQRMSFSVTRDNDEPIYGSLPEHHFNTVSAIYRSVPDLLSIYVCEDEKSSMSDLARAISVSFCANNPNYITKPEWPEEFTIEERKKVLQNSMVGILKRLPRNKQALFEYDVLEESQVVKALKESDGHKAVAVYPSHCFLNHSCLPNTHSAVSDHAYIESRVIRPIKPGDELTNCYGLKAGKDSRDERQSELLRMYDFVCECEACESFERILVDAEMTAFLCQCGTLLNARRDETCRQCDLDTQEQHLELQIQIDDFYRLIDQPRKSMNIEFLLADFAMLARKFHRNNKALNEVRVDLANRLQTIGERSEAEPLYVEFQRIIERHNTYASMKNAIALLNLADFYRKSGNQEKYEEFARKVAQIEIMFLGADRASKLAKQNKLKHLAIIVDEEAIKMKHQLIDKETICAKLTAVKIV